MGGGYGRGREGAGGGSVGGPPGAVAVFVFCFLLSFMLWPLYVLIPLLFYFSPGL